MSIDNSLKVRGALSRHRNVLTRDERVAHLKEEGIWSEGDMLVGLPKVAHRKVSVGKKEAVEKAPEAAVVVEEVKKDKDSKK